MKGKPTRLIILFISMMSLSFVASAQNNFGSEKELRKQADGLFKEDDYAAALPLYSQLLSLYPKDPNFNYKYGVCLLYAKENKEKPLPYLLFAVGKEGVDDDVYYHLGKAFHLNYRFDDAIAQYKTFKQKKNKASTKLEVDLNIQQCESGKNLLRNVTDLTVIEKKELNTLDYFRVYDLTKINAKLVVKPEELKTSFDIKKKDQSTVILRQTAQDIYYSSYGADGKNGRDIYRVTKLPNFTWGQPVNLGPSINTPYDEDFPYITPDGRTLYFCSKGHNSMGGYDVFKSELNPSGQWNKPNNLDFAVNTPDDDIQYITDPESDFAYFSSKRNSADGKIMVFKVRTERVPVTAAIIRGKVVSDATPTNLAAKISVKNVQTGKFIGTFNSSDKDGRYRMTLNNGSKYEFTVEQSGTPPITQFVEIPPLNELRPLKQEIKLSKKDGATSMKIYNYFNDTVENNALEIAEIFKEKANLDVNYEDQIKSGIISEANSKSYTDNRVLTNRNVYQESSAQLNSNNDKPITTNVENSNNGKKDESGIKNSELITIAKEDAKEAQKEADDLRDKSRQAYAFAGLKNNAAQKKYKEAAEAESKASGDISPSDKLAQLEVASKTKKDGDNLAQQAVVAFNLGKDLEEEADAKQIEATQAEQYANELDQAVKSNSMDAVEKLEKQSKELEKNETAAKSNNPDAMLKQAEEKYNEAKTLEESKREISIAIQQSMGDEKVAREQVLKAKNEDEKQEKDEKLKIILAERKEKQSELAVIDSKILKLKEEATSIEEEAKTNKEILAEIANESNLSGATLSPEEKQKLETQLTEAKNNNSNAPREENKTNVVANNPSPIQSKVVPEPKLENYASYVISTNENKKETLLKQQKQATASADSIALVLKNTTDQNEIQYLNDYQKNYQQLATSKKLAADMITFNINNREYEYNLVVLSQKVKEFPEADRANFKNSVSQVENEYSKAVAVREKGLQQNEITDQQAGVNEAVNAQNMVLVRQRKLLELANGITVNKNQSNAATENFTGFNNDKKAPATEAVNKLRPDYSSYNASVKISSTDAERIKETPAYIQFAEVIAKAKQYEENADIKAKEYNTFKLQGEEKMTQSQILIDSAAEESKNSKRQALVQEAIRSDNEGRDLLNKADTIKIEAQTEMLKAAAIKAEADKLLAKLDKAQQEKIIATYLNKIEVPSDSQVIVAKDAKNSSKDDAVVANQKTTPIKTNPSTQLDSKQVKSTEQQTAKKIEPTNSTDNQVSANKNNPSTNNPPKVLAKTKDKETLLAEIKSTNDYKEYAAIKDEVEKLKANAQAKRAEADTLKIQAQRDAINSNDLFEFAAAQSKKKERKEAQKKAEDLDRSARDNEIKADSVKAIAEKAETTAKLKQYEADSYLKKFDDAKAKTLLMAYNNAVPEELLRKEEAAPMLVVNDTSKMDNTVAQNQKNTDAQQKLKQGNDGVPPVKNNEVAAQKVDKKQSEQPQKKNIVNKNPENSVANNNNNTTQEINSNNNKLEQPQQEPVLKVKVPKPDVKTTPEYNKYIDLTKEAELANSEAAAWKARVDSTKAMSSQKLEESNNKLEEASTLKKKERKPLVKEAIALDYEGQVLARAADSLSVFANEAAKQARDKKAAAEAYIGSIDKDLALRIMRSIQGIPDPVEEEIKEVVTTNETKASEKTSTTAVILSKGIFNNKPHNASNPIKMNEPLPDGIVFKVQIGAFNRPVVDDAFGSVTPVSGETLPGSNLIRYTAGLFTAFNNAVDARKELNVLNYKDAFIVAYCYGKRMGVTEARNLLAEGKDCKNSGPLSPVSKVIAANETTENNNLINNPNVNAPAKIKQGETLPQQDIQVIKGLLYTVQVGVYSKPVKAGQLYNITPLYYEMNQKGLYKYTSGIFDNIREAVSAKNTIVQIGVTDAFVTAYNNGKRIPMEQAAALEAQQGNAVFAKAPGLNDQPRVIPMTEEVIGKENNKELSKNENKVSPANNVPANIVYKVQLGAFRKQVPVEIMNKYLSIADKGIVNFKNGDLTIYTVGNYNAVDAAEIMKAEVIAKGITDAFVIALNNGVKISLEEAQKLERK